MVKGASLDEIEVVYRRRLDEFLSVAAAILEDRDAARDVVQEAFAIAVRRRSTFRREGPLDAWLWRTVVNVARDARRRRGVESTANSRVASMNGGGPELTDIGVALALLPERQRLAVFLRYYADLDYRTIADVLEVATGTVAATLNAAHASLRRRFEEVSP